MKAVGIVLLGLGALVALAFAGIGVPEGAEGVAVTEGKRITVSGIGRVKIRPDRAELVFGVETQARTAQEALEANSTQMQRLLAALRAAGIAEADLQTAFVSVSPRYAEEKSTSAGFSASNSVRAEIRRLDSAGAIIDAAVEAGANLVSGPTFSRFEQADAERAALEAAIAHARTKAETVAKEAGLTLGDVMQIVEEGASSPPVPYAALAEDSRSATPIEPGMSDVHAGVSVTFAAA